MPYILALPMHSMQSDWESMMSAQQTEFLFACHNYFPHQHQTCLCIRMRLCVLDAAQQCGEHADLARDVLVLRQVLHDAADAPAAGAVLAAAVAQAAAAARGDGQALAPAAHHALG